MKSVILARNKQFHDILQNRVDVITTKKMKIQDIINFK